MNPEQAAAYLRSNGKPDFQASDVPQGSVMLFDQTGSWFFYNPATSAPQNATQQAAVSAYKQTQAQGIANPTPQQYLTADKLPVTYTPNPDGSSPVAGPGTTAPHPTNIGGSAANTNPTPGTTGTLPSSPSSHDQGLQDILGANNLTQDQKAAIQAIYDAVSTNDQAYADKLISAMKAGTAYSDPYFKAQINLVTDALSRGLTQADGDLSAKETLLQSSLDTLTKNTAASKDYLSFDHQQQLQDLARQYTQQLDTTQNDMAARGLTSSSIRSNAEQYLSDANTGMVQSANKKFTYQTGQLDNQLQGQTADTATQIAQLQADVAAGKIDTLRKAEAQVGSDTLTNLGYTGLLGGQGGSIPRDQAKDAMSFATSYVT